MDITSQHPHGDKVYAFTYFALLTAVGVDDAAAAFNMTLFNNWSLTQLDFYNDRFSQKQMLLSLSLFLTPCVVFFFILVLFDVFLCRNR